MRRLNQDAVIAIILLLASGVLFWSTFSIRTADYGVLAPSTWPRVITVALGILSAIYLAQSIKKDDGEVYEGTADRDPGIMAWLVYWKNPIICFVLFFAFLITLPVFGSLIGGILFVFFLMGFLGGFAPRAMLVHAALATATVGGMWAIFTYGLGVLLPSGMIFSPF